MLIITFSTTLTIQTKGLRLSFTQKCCILENRYEYGRSGNPTREVLEKCLAALDGAAHCVTFASGLAATTAITTLLKRYILDKFFIF